VERLRGRLWWCAADWQCQENSNRRDRNFGGLRGLPMTNNDELLDRLAIREIVENWALFRDARRWDRFRELWHDDG
jgi:hypothetical protein